MTGSNRLLINDREFDHVIDMIEDGYESNHDVTLDSKAGSDEYIEAQNRMRTARTMLMRLVEDHPLKNETIKAGVKFDWEAFWDSLDEDSEEGESEESDGREGDSEGSKVPMDRVTVAGEADNG